MSKACQQCGVKHRNDAKKCINCGAEFGDLPQRAKNKKLIILGIIGVLLIAAAVFALIYFTGPKAAVRRVMRSFKNNDVEAIVDSLPEFYVECEYWTREEVVKAMSGPVLEMSNYIFSYNIDSVKSPSDSERDELMETFKSLAGEDFDESDIEDIKLVWVNFTGNVPGFWPAGATRFIMIKYNGRWCYWPSHVGW